MIKLLSKPEWSALFPFKPHFVGPLIPGTTHHGHPFKCRMSNLGSRMSDVECRMSNLGCRMSDVGCRISDIRSVGCQISDVGCRMLDIKSRMSDGTYKLP